MQNISEETIRIAGPQRIKLRPRVRPYSPGRRHRRKWGALDRCCEPLSGRYVRAGHRDQTAFPGFAHSGNLSIQDWPLRWNEIEPYYTKAEELLGISGTADNIQGKLIEGGNVFERPRSKEYPVGPHKYSWSMTVFEKAARELGYHPYPSPAATLAHDYTNPEGVSRPGYAYCGYCMLFGCMIGAKAQPTSVLMPLLRREKRFTLRNHCWVRRIAHRDGRAEGVTYIDEHGRETMQRTFLVILFSFAPSNVKLLLLSKIGGPYDPESGKGTLGKDFCHQMSGGGGGQLVYKEPLNSFINAGGQGMYFSDFDSFNNLDADAGILRGGTFTGGEGMGHAISSFGNVSPGRAKRSWGAEWKKAAIEYHDRIGNAPGFSGGRHRSGSQAARRVSQ